MGAVAKSAYLRDNLIEHALGVASFTMPTNVYLALFTTDPTIDDDGVEVSGGSYARQQLSLDTASNGRCASNTSETFSSLPACVITHWGIYDASSGGNLLYFGKFDIPIIRNAAENLVIASGNIAVSEA